MQQHTPTSLHPLSYKIITRPEPLQNILILKIIDLNNVMLEPIKQTLVQGSPQGRHYMRNLGIFEGIFVVKGG